MFAMSQSAYFPHVLSRNSFARNLVIVGLKCSGAFWQVWRCFPTKRYTKSSTKRREPVIWFSVFLSWFSRDMVFGHAFLAALVLCLLYPKYYTYNAINTSSVHLSCSGTWGRVCLLNLVDGSIKTGCYSTIIVSSSLGWFGPICFAKLDYACGIPRAFVCFYNDNKIADLFLPIGQQRMRLRTKRKWFCCNIIYHRNLIIWNYRFN